LGKFLVVPQALARSQVGNIPTCHEGPITRPGDDDHFGPRVLLHILPGPLERQKRRDVQGIEHFRTIDGHNGRAIGSIGEDDILAHGRSSIFYASVRRAASTIRAASGRYCASSSLAKGTGMNGAPTRTM